MTNDKTETEKKIGERWSEVYIDKEPMRTDWWHCDFIKSQVNLLVADVDSTILSEGLNQLLKKQLNGRRLKTGVSVGCGVASQEMRLIEMGIAERFILFDYSDEALKSGAEKAKTLGLSDKVEFHSEDAFLHDFGGAEIELVHWNNSLHHMFDVPAAVKWSYDILAPGGVFYMDDYVGPNRFQFSDNVFQIINKLRSRISDNCVELGRINPESFRDPSEAVDSERILDSVRRNFPRAQITLTGGLVYFYALGGLYGLFDDDNEEHLAILKKFMEIEKLYTGHPGIPNLFATALAFK